MISTNIVVQGLKGYDAKEVQQLTLPSEGFTTRYDPEDHQIAIGCNNGTKILLSLPDFKVVSKVESTEEDPITCVKWRPLQNSKAKVLGIANAYKLQKHRGGHFEYYHVPSMKKLFSIEEKDNSLHCCDFTPNGSNFATAGKDSNIRIYDENTKSIVTVLGCAEWNHRGHSNRIFSVKFIDQNTLVSGGWDSVIHIWDIRQAKSVQSFFGPHVAGDSIDFKNDELLVGCYASKDQLQVYDIKTLALKEALSWNSSEDKDKVAYVYTASFSNSEAGGIVAGSVNTNEVRIYHRDREYGDKRSLSLLVRGLKCGCFSVDSSWKKQQLAFSTAQMSFFIYDYQQSA